MEAPNFRVGLNDCSTHNNREYHIDSFDGLVVHPQYRLKPYGFMDSHCVKFDLGIDRGKSVV